MSIALYMGHHVPRAITSGLRVREIDVLTAIEDAMDKATDPELLDRATQLNRALFTQDKDLLAEATARLREGNQFYGVIYAHQLRVSIGHCIQDLELIAKTATPEEVQNRVFFLPIQPLSWALSFKKSS